MGKRILSRLLRRKLGSAVAGIFLGIGLPAVRAADPVFASPLPPGPGQVPLVSGPLVAPILMPLSSPMAAPVGVYHYGSPTFVSAVEGAGRDATANAPAASAMADGMPRRGSRLWVAADFFYGASQGSWVPPLVTTSPAGTPPDQAGVTGLPLTTVAFGGRRYGNDFRPGFRLEAGVWCDDCRTWGIDGSYFFLGRQTDSYSATQPDPNGPQLYQPFILGTTGLAVPVGLTPGGVTAHVTTDVTGADLNYRRICRDSCGTRVALLAGYRFLALDDEVGITTARPFIGAPVPFTIVADTLFQTRNRFHGGQMGVSACHGFANGMTVEVLAKCALGVTFADAELSSTTSIPGSTIPGSLLVGQSNAGSFSDEYFAVVPEANVRIGYRITDCLHVSVGYSFLYWSRVQRAADQIELALPPVYSARTTDFWVQGWTMGVEVRY